MDKREDRNGDTGQIASSGAPASGVPVVSLRTAFRLSATGALIALLAMGAHIAYRLPELYTSRSVLAIVLLWAAAALMALATFFFFLRRWLFLPIGQLSHALQKLSEGNLDVELAVPGKNEIGQLSHHLNIVAEKLRERAAADKARVGRTEERTQKIIEATLDAVVVIDHAGLVREWNPQAESSFGWTRPQMLGVHLASLLFPDSPGSDFSASQLIEQAIRGNAAPLDRHVHTKARRRSGESIPIEIAISKLVGDETAEFAIFIRDLSSQLATQSALAKSEVRYRAAFEQSAVGIAEIGSEGRFLRVNPAAASLIGRTPSEVVGIHFSEVVSPETLEDDRTAFQSILRGELPFVRQERRARRTDGNAVWVDITAAPVRESDGSLAYVFVTVQDVSERRRLEEELRQSQKMEAVGQLAGGVAHDFNNLLTGIMGYADLLQHEAGVNETVRNEANAIVATAQRGAELAQKLLSLSRQAPTQLIDIDVREIVIEVHSIIKRAFDRNIELRLDLDDRTTEVQADKTQISNAILNLALNARDAMPSGGRLSFRTRRIDLDAQFCARFAGPPVAGPYVAITVTDTGTGVASDIRERIFEPFFTTKDPGKGTGLGLSMVYGSVRAHGGMVEVDSRVGRGTTFTVYLPRLESPSEPAIARPAENLVTGHGHVLLADDEDTVREVGARMLRRLGYTVDVVSDGQQALDKFREAPGSYAFVILDSDMPRMRGRDAAREMLNVAPECTIFLASGYRSPGSPGTQVPDGFAAVLSKPYTLIEMSRLIATHILPSQS